MSYGGFSVPNARDYLNVGAVLDIRVDQYRDLAMKLGYNVQLYQKTVADVAGALSVLADETSESVNRVKDVALPRLANMSKFLYEEHNRVVGPVTSFTSELESVQASLTERQESVVSRFRQIANWYYELEAIARVVPGLASHLPASWEAAPVFNVEHVLVSQDDTALSTVSVTAAVAGVERWQQIAASWRAAVSEVENARTFCVNMVSYYERLEQQLTTLFQSSGFAAMHSNGGDQGAFKRAFLITVGGVQGMRSSADRAQLWILFSAPLDQQLEAYLKWRQVADPALVAYLDSLIGAATGVVDAKAFAKIYDYKNSPFTPEEMFKFNNLMGIEKGVQDVFARLFLEYANAESEAAYATVMKHGTFHCVYGEKRLELQTFIDTVNHIRNEALPKAAYIADRQHVDGVQVFGLGVDRDVLTANIALGNVDTATNVTVNFLGMNSNTNQIANELDSSRDNLKQAINLSKELNLGNTFAVVVSISHKSTDFLTVGGSDSAREAVNPVTELLDGINYSRGVEKGGSPADQGFRLDTRWHSYATRDASAIAEAESKGIDALETNVSSFSLYGSPGIISGLEASDFPADRVYVTKAEKDKVDDLGGVLSGSFNSAEYNPVKHHENPDSIPGVELYNSDGGDGYKAVTSHDRHIDQTERPGEYGYDNYNTSSNYATALIMNGLEPELLNETGKK